jgi:hypothetical protein
MYERLDETMSLEFAAYCEEIREELGNKFVLLGVVTGDLLVAEFPANVRVSFLLGIRSKEIGERVVKVRLMVDELQAFEGESKAIFGDPWLFANTVIPSGIVVLGGPCQLSLLVSTEEGRWIEALSKRVMHGAAPA